MAWSFHFFDTCWTEADGDKADIADIAIRMMTTGDGPRKDTGKEQGATEKSATASDQSGTTLPPKPDDVTDEEWANHLAIMKAIGDYDIIHPGAESFMSEDEIIDPRLRMWRETLRQRYNFNKSRQQHEQPETSE